MVPGEQPSVSELRARLDRVREALRDMPPHAGSGTRRALEEESLRLERRLADQVHG